jgi:hypothetical protein
VRDSQGNRDLIDECCPKRDQPVAEQRDAVADFLNHGVDPVEVLAMKSRWLIFEKARAIPVRLPGRPLESIEISAVIQRHRAVALSPSVAAIWQRRSAIHSEPSTGTSIGLGQAGTGVRMSEWETSERGRSGLRRRAAPTFV